MGLVEQIAIARIATGSYVGLGKRQSLTYGVAATRAVLTQHIIHEVAVDNAVLC